VPVTVYVTRRLFHALLVVVGVTIIIFLLEHLLPGTLAKGILGPHASAPQIALFKRQNGLDKPLVSQYLLYLGHLVHGNLGRSFHLNESVDTVLAQDLPKDIVLVGPAFALSVLLAIPIGLLQATRRGKATDNALTVALFTFYATPSFAFGVLLLEIFAERLKWLPAEAPQSTTVGGVLSDPLGLVLPVITLTLFGIPLFSRYMRSSAIDILAQDFVRTARAKGSPGHLVVSRHVLRNALLSVVTLVGMTLPGIFTAGLVVEYLFNYPGTGLAYYNAAVDHDYALELGITLVIAVAVVLGNLLADLALMCLDPRIRLVGNDQ